MLCDSLILIGSAILNEKNTERLDKIGKSMDQTPLYDALHNLFPNLSSYDKIIDLFPILLGTIVLYLLCVQHPSLDLKSLIRNIWIVVLLRMVMCSVTIFPSPICKIKRAEAIGGCHDCMFSGHTSITLLLSYCIYQCFPHNVCKYSLLVYSIVSSIVIIASRNHYTVDVIVAWLVVYSLLK